jgi:hypothetical protein
VISWACLASDIRWLIGMNNFIEVYHNVLSKSECNFICDEVDELVQENHTGVSFKDEPSRIDASIFINEYGRFNGAVKNIRNILHSSMSHYAQKYDVGYIKSDLEAAVKIQKSSEGQGFFTWHNEQGHGENNNTRYLVWMIYLNDVTEGGHTEFKHFDLKFTPKEGTLLLWPASLTHLHRAAPTLKQDKYIATGWFKYD